MAAALCEQLHYEVSANGGACIFFPNIAEKNTSCRYEFHYVLPDRNREIQLGFHLKLGQGPLEELDIYATTPEHVRTLSGAPEFSDEEIHLIQAHANEILARVWRRCESGSDAVHYVILHMECPLGFGTTNVASTNDDSLTIFPTRIVNDDGLRASAVAFRVAASSKEAARVFALQELGKLCALLSLSTGYPFQEVFLKSTPSHPITHHLESISDISIDSLYPHRDSWAPLESLDPHFAGRLQWVWETFHILPSLEQKEFLTALLAYYAGLRIRHSESTLAIVSYFAALNSLAIPFKEYCPGDLACTECGGMPWRHHLVGDVAAIAKLLLEVNLIDLPDEQEMKKFLHRVYGEQRSAFVHGAELRHHEFHQGGGLPPALPAANDPVQPVAYYLADLLSLSRITRRGLLHWLSKRSNRDIDRELLGISASVLIDQAREGIVLGLTGGVLAQVDMRMSAPTPDEGTNQ